MTASVTATRTRISKSSRWRRKATIDSSVAAPGTTDCFRKPTCSPEQALGNAAAALEILSNHPIGIGVSHGWVPAGGGWRVTEVDGSRLIGLNGAPAVEAFEQHAESTQQLFDRANPLPFFLHNVLGIVSEGGYRLRVPLGVDAEGAVSCAAAVPEGAVVHIVRELEKFTPLLAALLGAEQEAVLARAEASATRDAAKRAETLAIALEAFVLLQALDSDKAMAAVTHALSQMGE